MAEGDRKRLRWGVFREKSNMLRKKRSLILSAQTRKEEKMRKFKKVLLIIALVILGIVALLSLGMSFLQMSRSTPSGTREIAQQGTPLEVQANVAVANPALQNEIAAFRQEVADVRGEYSKIREELSTARREVSRLEGRVEQMTQSNGLMLQAALLNKTAEGSSATPVVIMTGTEKGQAPQPINLDSAVFRAAVKQVIVDALLSVHLPESTSSEELALFKTAFGKAVEQLFIDSKEPLPAGVTLQTAFARNTKVNALEGRVKQNEDEAVVVAASLHKEQNGSYSKVAKNSDVITAQKTASDVTTDLENFKKLVYDKEKIEAIKEEIYASIDGVKGDVVVSESNIKNLGVALANCVWGHEYTKKRKKALGILYLIFGDDFQIEQIKKARSHARKMILPYRSAPITDE